MLGTNGTDDGQTTPAEYEYRRPAITCHAAMQHATVASMTPAPLTCAWRLSRSPGKRFDRPPHRSFIRITVGPLLLSPGDKKTGTSSINCVSFSPEIEKLRPLTPDVHVLLPTELEGCGGRDRFGCPPSSHRILCTMPRMTIIATFYGASNPTRFPGRSSVRRSNEG